MCISGETHRLQKSFPSINLEWDRFAVKRNSWPNEFSADKLEHLVASDKKNRLLSKGNKNLK